MYGDSVFSNMEKIEILSAYDGVSSIKRKYENRPSHGFVYKYSGESLYVFDNKKIKLSAGEILFIPKGSSYEVRRLNIGESRYAVINFSGEGGELYPKKFDLSASLDAAYLFDRAIKSLIFPSAQGRYTALALFYELLAHISSLEERSYFSSEKRQLIAPALKYLESHIFDSNLKTEALHTFCGLSDTYFRRIFISVMGVSPKQYITNKRLIKAKNILDSGDYSYIYEVAAAVGFSDPLYFGKLFKKHYGYLPSKK